MNQENKENELKFIIQKKEAKDFNFKMYNGNYKFSTQSTTLYEEYCLVNLKDHIMKLKVNCQKMFYANEKLGILNNGEISIYCPKDDHFEYKEKLNVRSHNNINDLWSGIEDDIKKYDSKTWFFSVNNEPLIVKEDEIFLGGVRFRNEIYQANCKYFVAYIDSIVILGNDISLNFMYFKNKQLAIIDEENSIFCRMNEDFMTIELKDLKFYDDKVLAMDSEKTSVFVLAGYERCEMDIKKVIEYEIIGNNIVMVDKKNDSIISDIEGNHSWSNKNVFKGSNSSVFSLNDSTKSINISEQDKPKSSGPFSIENTLRNSNLSESKTVQDEGKYTKLQNKELEMLAKKLTLKIDHLKVSFQNLSRKKALIPELGFVPSKYDLSELYFAINNNKMENFEEILSSMILRMENVQVIDENNLEECRKYFDLKILSSHNIKRPVNYSGPLISKFKQSLSLESPVRNFIENFKIIKIGEPLSTNIDFNKNEKLLLSSTEERGKTFSENMKYTENIGQSNTGNLNSEIKNHIATSNFAVSNATVNSREDASQNNSGGPFASAKAFDFPMFKNEGNNTSQMKNTGSLFDSVVNSSLRTDLVRDISLNSTNNQSQNQDSNKSQTFSAFNRFAGSKNIFK